MLLLECHGQLHYSCWHEAALLLHAVRMMLNVPLNSMKTVPYDPMLLLAYGHFSPTYAASNSKTV